MKDASAFEIRSADWAADRDLLEAVRRAVFVVEQAVPEALEWDQFDAVSRHALAVAPDGAAIVTARLLPDGHIGRVAVLAPWRGRGVGGALLQHLLDAARRAGLPEVKLNAQVRALGFYRRFGFVAEGEVFDDAGIEHKAMRLKLAADIDPHRNGDA